MAVRLIVEREREIQNFKSEEYYVVNGIFAITNPDGSASEVKAQLSSRFKTAEEVLAFLEQCKTATYTVESIQKKPIKRTPAPLHHVDPSAGGRPKAWPHCQSDDDDRPASV